MYSVASYGRMVADRGRMDPYFHALQQVVRPGCTVLDIGTGTGVFALLACGMGAVRVYAIEADPAIEVARQNAVANGVADRITFYPEMSTRVELPERVDVVVSDLRGIVPLLGHHIPAIVDARRRFLLPGGSLIPRKDELWAAVVEAPAAWEGLAGPWGGERYGLDLTSARRITTSTFVKEQFGTENLLSDKAHWATIDYRTVDQPNVAGALEWEVSRGGTGHGIVLWFDTELADGIGFSNEPGKPKLIYGGGFFPWPQAVPLNPGDQVQVKLAAHLVGDDYVWSWNTRVGRSGPEFRQSTFHGGLASGDALRRSADHHRARLGPEGEVVRAALERMDGTRTLGELAEELCRRFPERFAGTSEALALVARLSRSYGE